MNDELRARLDRELADAIGLLDAEPASLARGESRKLVCFVPTEALEVVRDAVFAAGAGVIGDYTRCSWYCEGTGTFLGGEGAAPAVGEAGREERVPELRLETVYPPEREAEVVEALLAAHPYEEPAFDLYPLANLVPGHRAGLVGRYDGDLEARLRWLGIAFWRRTIARGERIAVFTGAPGPTRADVVVAPVGEPDLLAPGLEAWALARVGA